MESIAEISMKIKAFDEFGIMLGCAANAVPRIETLEKYADVMAALGYNALYLETADTYKIEGEPYFGYMRGGYTKEEIRRLDAYCAARGIELVPAIQTLAHLHFLRHYERYSPLIDVEDILLAEEEQTYALIDKMFAAIAEMYTSRRVNIGMDEAYLLGAGKYLYRHGYRDRTEIMLAHLQKVLAIAEKYGFRCEMWSDMFFHAISGGNVYEAEGKSVPPEWKARVPKNLKLVYWEYFVPDAEKCGRMIDMHRAISDNVKYAGTFFRWHGVAPANAFTNKVMKRALTACKDRKVRDVFFALWADYGGGASIFAMLPAMYELSRFAENDCRDGGTERGGFERLFGVPYEDFALLDALNYPATDFKTKKVSDHRLNNKSFFYLYNDVFYGTFDGLLHDGISAQYANVRDRLREVNAGEYSYLFDTLAALADVLSVKAELGKRIRTAYGKGDKQALRAIAEGDIPALLKKLGAYCAAFERQWMKENKPFGFEAQNIRLGGLKERLAYAKRTLEGYLGGGLDRIAELEEPQQPFGYSPSQDEDSYQITRYLPAVTHGFL